MSTIANLRNIALCDAALRKTITRPRHQSGVVVMSSPAGYGKSVAAANMSMKHNGIYVECKKAWTAKDLMRNIAKACGIPLPKRSTTTEIQEYICDTLCDIGDIGTQRPLIIDDAHYLVNSDKIDYIKDIHNGCGTYPILLIGEDSLDKNLERNQAMNSRVIEWVRALPANLADVQLLVSLYAPDITISEDLIHHLHSVTKGNVRYIVNNIERISYEAHNTGATTIDLATWGDRRLHTGKYYRDDQQ